jgi:transforming growth factor-beta-induced protein
VPTTDPCSITEIVCDNPEFTYFCASLTATGIAEAFDDYSGNYTVFAPSDSAFEKLGDVAIAYLMQPENVDLLSKLLAFHTVEDEIIYSHDLTCQSTIEMSNGKDSRSVCRKQKLYQKGKGNSVKCRPEVVEVDIETCNGVIHVVNQVMLFDFPEELGIPPMDATLAPTGVTSPTPAPSVAPSVSKARNPVSCKTVGKCESGSKQPAVENAVLRSRNQNNFLTA